MNIKTALHTEWTGKYLAAASIYETGTNQAQKKVARMEMKAYEEGLRVLHTWTNINDVADSLRSHMNDRMRRAQRTFFITMLHDIEIARDDTGGRSDES